MASVATATAFERTLENINLPKHDVNLLVMDFLVQQGYPDAAARFAEEANIETGAENALMDERVKIRNAIYQGNLQMAIEEINEIDTQLLDNDQALLFSLHRLQLIELIKQVAPAPETEKAALINKCLVFAQQNLSPYTPRSHKFKRDLEKAMSLLIVPREKWSALQSSPSQPEHISAFGDVAELVDPSLKMEVANNVNAAILKSVGRKERSRIHNVLQTRAWSENLARENRISLPQDMTVSLHEMPAGSQSQNGNNGDTQMTEDTDDSRSAEERYTNLHESQR